MGFDQWSVFYLHYNVLKSRIRVTFPTTTGITTGTSIYGIQLVSTPAVSSTFSAVCEQALTRKQYIAPQATGYVRPITVTHSFDAAKYFSLTNTNDSPDVYGASISLNPSEDAYYAIFQASTDLGVTMPVIYIVVEMELLVQFSEPQNLPSS